MNCNSCGYTVIDMLEYTSENLYAKADKLRKEETEEKLEDAYKISFCFLKTEGIGRSSLNVNVIIHNNKIYTQGFGEINHFSKATLYKGEFIYDGHTIPLINGYTMLYTTYENDSQCETSGIKYDVTVSVNEIKINPGFPPFSVK